MALVGNVGGKLPEAWLGGGPRVDFVPVSDLLTDAQELVSNLKTFWHIGATRWYPPRVLPHSEPASRGRPSGRL